MSASGTPLFDLLPALYRLRDASLAGDETKGPLECLLLLIEEQLAALVENLDQFYDDQFIETSAPWVIPYIGDLIAFQSIHGIAPAVASPRAEVANTIACRRRKGTLLVMEQLARDVTAWPAHAVEFFQVLGDTQYMNHIRPANYYAPDLRGWKPGLYMNSAFDRTSHTVDVRRIATRLGRYNIQNIGIFLWSLTAFGITRADATSAAAQTNGFRFDALGRDMPLFNNPVSQGDKIAETSQPANVPDRLRRRVLCEDLRKGIGATYYGEGKSLAIYVNDALLSSFQIQTCDLSGADGSWANTPVPNTYMAAVDPELGRIALSDAAGTTPTVEVSYYYGFNAELGGGQYTPKSSLVVNSSALFPFPDTETPQRYTTLQDALDVAAAALPGAAEVVVEIITSDTYSTPGLTVDLPAGSTVELRAAESARPTVILDGEISVTGDERSTFNLNGLMIWSDQPAASPTSALVHAPLARPNGEDSHLGNLNLIHCTLTPGWSATSGGDPVQPGQPVLVAETAGLRVIVQKSILGPILADELVTVEVSNSVIDSNDTRGVAFAALDGSGGGATLKLDGCTVVGKVHATLLDLVSNSIVWADLAPGDTFQAGLWSDRKQVGCVRFSYLPAGSITPRRFECLEWGPGAAQPLFYSLRLGDPAYAKLLPCTDDLIRRGADDNGEMGAFHFVLAPLRETDLNIRMQEYLPVGLEFATFYQN